MSSLSITSHHPLPQTSATVLKRTKLNFGMQGNSNPTDNAPRRKASTDSFTLQMQSDLDTWDEKKKALKPDTNPENWHILYNEAHQKHTSTDSEQGVRQWKERLDNLNQYAPESRALTPEPKPGVFHNMFSLGRSGKPDEEQGMK